MSTGTEDDAAASMFRFYIQQYHIYREKYGPHTAIFLQVGKFYEFYDILEHGESQANVRDIVDLLGVQLSRKAVKGLRAEQECLFAGVPDAALHRWAGRLTLLGWTIVIFDQVKDARDHVVRREVTRILTPSTHIEAVSSTETPYVLSLILMQTANVPPWFGVALVDLTTGTTKTYTGQAQGRAEAWTADDVIQLMSVYPPREVLVYYDAPYAYTVDTMRRILCLPAAVIRVSPCHAGAFGSATTRAEYLQRVYQIRSALPPRTFLSLRTTEEETALLYALQFIEEHCPSLLRQFHRNEPWIPHLRLICGNHALTQLQMCGAGMSVLSLFDKAVTPMGKRATKERLLTPYAQAAEIQARLREVRAAYEWPEKTWMGVLATLRVMFDLPRLHRRLLCGTMTPSEITNLYQTYHAMESLSEILQGSVLEGTLNAEWRAYRTTLDQHLSEEKAAQASDDMTPLNAATYPTVGEKEAVIADLLVRIQMARMDLCKATGLQESAIKLEENATGYVFRVTMVGMKHLKKYVSAEVRLQEKGSYGYVETPALVEAQRALQVARRELAEEFQRRWADVCVAVSSQAVWSAVEEWVAHVDVTQCLARVSKERGFHCPQIEEGVSCVEIEQLRHPLVEASATRSQYVKHSVMLGSAPGSSGAARGSARPEDVSPAKGWLVYGMNASGKSTLMKATGLCILLAQAGCFVPAKSMRLCPFRAVYTRILNQDNLFAGLSSFAVEMSELRDILRGADEYSLILGDELCAGTESISAQALVLSGIQWLTARRATFIFATHLHDLATHLAGLPVEVWHLHVEYDPVTQRLVYDRSLRRGQGSTLYGLEVARAMDLPREFIDQALKNRHLLMGTTTQEQAHASTWSRDILRRECERCHAPVVRELEVHHIQERATAVGGILPDGTPMNDKRNLVTLCEACHDRVHAGETIAPMVDTSEGPMRLSVPMQPTKKHSKWTEEEKQTITDTIRAYPSLALKALRGLLQARHEIQMSEATLRAFKAEVRG